VVANNSEFRRAVVLWVLLMAATFGAGALVRLWFGIWAMVAFCLVLAGVYVLIGARRRRQSDSVGSAGGEEAS
jgi:hypothetical protein